MRVLLEIDGLVSWQYQHQYPDYDVRLVFQILLLAETKQIVYGITLHYLLELHMYVLFYNAFATRIQVP